MIMNDHLAVSFFASYCAAYCCCYYSRILYSVYSILKCLASIEIPICARSSLIRSALRSKKKYFSANPY